MARSWAEFLGDPEEAPAEEEERRGWFGRLRESLSASRQALTRELLFDPGDEEAWERIVELHDRLGRGLAQGPDD